LPTLSPNVFDSTDTMRSSRIYAQMANQISLTQISRTQLYHVIKSQHNSLGKDGTCTILYASEGIPLAALLQNKSQKVRAKGHKSISRKFISRKSISLKSFSQLKMNSTAGTGTRRSPSNRK